MMEKYFDFLDDLRDSGETNMFGAAPYLQEAFLELRSDRKKANEILVAWIHRFDKDGEYV